MKTKEYLNYFIFILIIASAIFLRFYNYNFQDFWWDELVAFLNVDPSLSLKETYLRAHSHTIGTDLDYDYAENANFYIYIYKFILGIFSYTPGVGRIITASFGLLVVLISIVIYKNFIGKNIIFFSILVAFNYYLVIQSQEFRYNIFFCFISLICICFFFYFINEKIFINKKITKFFYFLTLFLTLWTNIFGFIIYFSQLLTLLLKNRNLLFKNIAYYFSIPILYLIINFKQLVNFSKISYFPVPNKQLDFFLDYDFKYFFGSIISGKIFLIIFLFLFFYNIRKILISKFEIVFLFILLFCSYFLPIIYSIISKPILQTRYIIYLVPVIIILIVFMIDLLKIKSLKVIITSILILISTSNTIYSLYILKKNDKPHITKVLNKISEIDHNSKIHLATSNIYLLNFLKRKTEFENLNINFISCEKLNSLSLKTYWEIDIFPARGYSCRRGHVDSDIDIRDSIEIKRIEERYAQGYKFSYK